MKKNDGRGLNHGNPGNKGGGRPPDWLKNKCAGLIEKHKLMDWLADVAAGREEDADIRDRLRAVEMLADRAWGKPAQSMELSGQVAGRFVIERPSAEGAQ